MRPFSSSIWTKPILPNKPVQPILTAAIQLPRFSSFSPVVSQSISTIDWMKNLLTSLNLLLMKRGKRRGVRQPASKLTHKKMERVETPGKKKGDPKITWKCIQRYHLEVFLSISSSNRLLWFENAACISALRSLSLSLWRFGHCPVYLSLCLFQSFCSTGCTWDRNCTLTTSFSDWPGDRE